MQINVFQNVFVRHNEITANRPSIWCLHGFADSGLAYLEIFDSPLAHGFNIYVVDLPGFGVSPINPKGITMKAQADLLIDVIRKETKYQQQVNIIAHSLGALIGTWVCKELKDKIGTYFNLEGNLTEADSYFSSKPLNFDTAEAFASSFNGEIFEHASKEERYRRYYSSLRFANPEGMRNWSLTSQEFVQDNQSGKEFINLSCNKIYIWGDPDTPLETQQFINDHQIPNKLYKGIGHWHMVENPVELYGDIYDALKDNP